jgi:hypothetical protein
MRCQHGQSVTPEHAVDVEDASQPIESHRLVRRIGVNKLRPESEEEITVCGALTGQDGL